MKYTRPNGVVLWHGKSAIDGKRIVVILTGLRRKTNNRKTGQMLQTWILRSDVDPVAAVRRGLDISVCGSCPLRGIVDRIARKNRWRACYVNVGQAPLAIWRAWKRGSYPDYDPAQHDEWIVGRFLRIGSYGDGTAAPYAMWRDLLRKASGHTGYTHQWRESRFWRFRRFLMASCETVDDMKTAQARGWRTFRTRSDVNADILPEEFICPASDEAGKRLSCDQCGACNGAGANPDRHSVVIVAHGSIAVLGGYRHLVA